MIIGFQSWRLRDAQWQLALRLEQDWVDTGLSHPINHHHFGLEQRSELITKILFLHAVLSVSGKFVCIYHLEATLLQVKVKVGTSARHTLLLVSIFVKIIFHGSFRLLSNLALDKIILQSNFGHRSGNSQILMGLYSHSWRKECRHFGVMCWLECLKLFALPKTAPRNVGDAWSYIRSVTLFDSKSCWIFDLLDILRFFISIPSDSVGGNGLSNSLT